MPVCTRSGVLAVGVGSVAMADKEVNIQRTHSTKDKHAAIATKGSKGKTTASKGVHIRALNKGTPKHGT